jgi:mono/diheme cytochrome c family protein
LAPLARAVSNKVNWTGKPAPPPPPAVAPLTPEEQKRFEAGKVVFLGLCAGCHNDDGQGKEKLGANLVTSKYVQANVAFPIRILTQGKEGPIGLMPPVVGMLSDEQIAAALTYIRREWGHTASAVTASDVRETRQSQTHKGPWTEAELSGLLAGGGGRGGRGGGN